MLALRVADKGAGMARKRYTTEQIICKLREAEVELAKYLKQLEQENSRLKRIVADQAVDLSILKEVSKGNF